MDQHDNRELPLDPPLEQPVSIDAVASEVVEPVAQPTNQAAAPVAPEASGAPEAPVEPVAPVAQAPAPAAATPRQGVSVGGAIAIAIAASLVVGSLAGGAAGLLGIWIADENAAGGSTTGTIKVIPTETEEPVVAASVAAIPSVVNIDVSGESVSAGEKGLPGEHPSVPVAGSGSGVAYKSTDDGGTYILTNNHVVEDATSIVVTDAERVRHKATLVGKDPETDIAVVRVGAKIPLIKVGNSDELQVGQLVVAIGSPFGLTQSVSSGVVSAIGRSLPNSLSDSASSSYPLVDVIQTDAAINPGNSGGPLVDRMGLLIGINSAIYSESGANDGIGFAIPVANAQRIADQLIAGGTAQHPFLGVVGRDIDAQLMEQESLTVQQGAYIIEITKGSNAEKAGLKPGDVIVTLDDEKILGMDDLLLQVRRKKIGDEVILGVYRNGKPIDVTMTVGIKPENLEVPSLETTVAP